MPHDLNADSVGPVNVAVLAFEGNRFTGDIAPALQDLQAIASDLAPGSSAVIVVRENTWAAGLGAAVRDSKGEVLMLERIPRDVVVQAVAALQN